MTTKIQRPSPAYTDIASPFWEACQQHKLVVQQCTSCNTLRHYPQTLCPACQSMEYDWKEISGKGKIYTYTISHIAFHPFWKDTAPYAIITVELDEGIRMVSDLLEYPNEDLIGKSVDVTFEMIDENLTIPQFILT